jgi:2-(1,2-epoxy-1,2-dihydrophenyl)acetyl-CoA isomerase
MNNNEFLLDLEDGIATITFNRPTKSNAMGLHYSAGFNEVLDRVEADRSLRCLIVTGTGKIFNGGGDLHEIMSPDPTDLEEELKLIRGYNRVVKRLYYFDLPVIAAVNGPAVGGGSAIALASETARYDFFFHRLGLSVADVGVPWLLNRAIGPVMTNYYLLTAGSIDAQTGRRLGLFADVVTPDELLACARATARKIIEAPAPTLRISKLSTRHGVDMEFTANMEMEAYLQSHAFQLPAHKRRIGEYRERLSEKKL